jgi:Kef-type K+ transport system membrane component KefB
MPGGVVYHRHGHLPRDDDLHGRRDDRKPLAALGQRSQDIAHRGPGPGRIEPRPGGAAEPLIRERLTGAHLRLDMDPSLLVATVLIVAGIVGLELGISTAITEVLAGLLLGLFLDVSSMQWLDFLAHLGMLGLMFMAGFEVDPQVFRRQWRASLGIGTGSFLAPLAGVYVACHWAFGTEPRIAGLLGIGLSTTSLALVYHFLRERDLLRGEGGQMVLGAAMVVDVLSMLGLAVLLGRLGWASVVLVVAGAPALWSLPRLGQWVFSRYRSSVVEFELRFLLTVLVGLGFLAEHAGIHAAVASFVAGLVLSEVVQEHEVLEEKLKGVVFSFFAPVFFLRAGTQLDLRGLDVGTLTTTLVLFSVATSLKYLGTAGTARRWAPRIGHFAGVLFNYRLTFGIITATVGLQEGLLDARWFSVVLLIVVGSAVLPMALLRDLPAELDR